MKLSERITLLASAIGVDIKALRAKFSDYAPKTGVPGDFTTGGRLIADQVNIRGQNDAETDAFSIRGIFGVGLQFARSWFATNAGELYNQGNARIKADGDLILQGKGKTITLTDSGVAVSGNMLVDGGLTVSLFSLAPPTVVQIDATQAALLAAIAAATKPTVINWTGVITMTSDIELQSKTALELNCNGKGGLYRDNSPSMVVIRGNLKNCVIRGISFDNKSTGSGGSLILFNEQGPVDGLYIEHSTFVNTGTGNNGISSNSSGGDRDQYITSHNNIYIRYNKFGGAVMPGAGISRMAIELKNHSADGPGPIQYCDKIFVEHNEVFNCGTGSDDGFGISLSGLFRYGRCAKNTIVDCKSYSIEGVLLSDFIIEDNDVTDIINTSNGISLSNGYKSVNALPAGCNRKVIVRNNRINVKGRGIMSYYVTNSEFTRNHSRSGLRCEWIGSENTITHNKLDVWNDWNAARFESSSRNRVVDNEMTTYYHGNGVYTSSVIFFDVNSNDNYVRLNTLTRPLNSYNVHIEQKSGVSNDIGTASGSSTNTNNTYVDKRPNTLNSDALQVDTYAALTALLPVNAVTNVLVVADEKNNSGNTSEYSLYPSGIIMWRASQKVS